MKVLVADDSLVMRRLLESTLEGWGFEVVPAQDGEEAWQILQSGESPELAILDWMMPVRSGLDLCRMVRELKRPNYVYLLLLTSRSEREDIVEGLSAGADDYVVKPFDKHELEVRLRAGRRIIELQQQLLEAQEALREQATHDGLTKIWNRGSILEILEREVDRARREGRPLGVVMMDIDYFKAINDEFGHQAGDDVLREAARRVQELVRHYDAFGRYGGEEFLLVTPGSDGETVFAHAERLRLAIADQPFIAGENEIRVTSSFGICAMRPDGTVTAHQLIRAADDALYQAKRHGRNRTATMEAGAAARTTGG